MKDTVSLHETPSMTTTSPGEIFSVKKISQVFITTM